jgi:thiamine-phosphate pyrophosphorylase
VCPLPPTRKPLLCYVTDRRSLAASPGLAIDFQLQKIEQAAKAGADWIQIREKDLSGRELAGLVERAMTRVGSGSAVLVNDRVDVACASGASGVHLGERSLPPSEAKRLVELRCPRKDFFVGVSVHSLERAMAAEQAGADYVIFGPVYATPSKANFGHPQGVQGLQEICKRLTIPVLAIGGITLANAGDCLAVGAAGIAAIRLFQDAANLDDLVRELRKV